MYFSGSCSHGRRDGKKNQTPEKRLFAALAVGNRPDQQLTSCEAPHDVRQPELNHGRGRMEIRCLLRKRRQIEVCDEGPEGGQRGKKEQQKNATVG